MRLKNLAYFVQQKTWFARKYGIIVIFLSLVYRTVKSIRRALKIIPKSFWILVGKKIQTLIPNTIFCLFSLTKKKKNCFLFQISFCFNRLTKRKKIHTFEIIINVFIIFITRYYTHAIIRKLMSKIKHVKRFNFC